MRRSKSIFFVADGSEGKESVLTRAARLASANGAELTLFDALPVESYRFNDVATASAVEAINRAHVEERAGELEDLRRSAGHTA